MDQMPAEQADPALRFHLHPSVIKVFHPSGQAQFPGIHAGCKAEADRLNFTGKIIMPAYDFCFRIQRSPEFQC